MSDTSTKRVLEVAKFHEASEELYADNPEDSGRRAMHHISATLLRTLAAERDALRAALKECADDLEAEIMNKYGDWVPKYPRERQKRDQDMEPVKKARAALGEKE